MSLLMFLSGCIALVLAMSVALRIAPLPGPDWPDPPKLPRGRVILAAFAWRAYLAGWQRYLVLAARSLKRDRWEHLRGACLAAVLGTAALSAADAVGGAHAPNWRFALLVDSFGLLSVLHTWRRWLHWKAAQAQSDEEEVA